MTSKHEVSVYSGREGAAERSAAETAIAGAAEHGDGGGGGGEAGGRGPGQKKGLKADRRPMGRQADAPDGEGSGGEADEADQQQADGADVGEGAGFLKRMADVAEVVLDLLQRIHKVKPAKPKTGNGLRPGRDGLQPDATPTGFTIARRGRGFKRKLCGTK